MKDNTKNQVPILYPDAAGIDIGSGSHFVAVPSERDTLSVREFKSFTPDLHKLADWLGACGIKTVAMESTSVYWIPLYELLESRGFEVLLVNARHVKNVPGRKSDVLDCQWLQRLHSYGLLQASFRPNQAICELRAYMRQRELLIQCSSMHIQHMQKAIAQMNVQLTNVVSDITGATGMRVIRAIVAGERSPEQLAKFRDKRCKTKEDVIAQALMGNYRDEHVFALKQAVELYDLYQEKMIACDREIEKVVKRLENNNPKTAMSVMIKPHQKKKRKTHALHFAQAEEHLIRLTGVDLTKVDGLSATTALKLISEIGLDMSRWKTAKHFGSWLGLAPGTKISGGKVLSSKTKPSSNRAATMLRIVASTLHHSHCALGAYLRRLKARLGSPKAITATAYKIARLIYSLLKYGNEYVDVGQDYYEQQYKQRVLKNMQTKAKRLGFQLVPLVQNN